MGMWNRKKWWSAFFEKGVKEEEALTDEERVFVFRK
jgi:hypothetical protein